MSGELRTDVITPDDMLEVKGKLKVENTVTLDSIESIQSLDSVMNDDQIKDTNILISRGDDSTVAGISVIDTLIPPGTIFPFGGSDVPLGWLPCDGTFYDSEPVGQDNPFYRLFQAVGYNWGQDGTRFRVPDLRGRFIRGIDNSKGNDPDAADRRKLNTDGGISEEVAGDVVGSYQDDEFKEHTHKIRCHYNSGDGDVPWQGTWSPQPFYDSSEEAGGNETRPQNAAVNFIIKY